jgi:outer membrane lipoprotein-sorting protein|tara:strand:- start:13 stop:327 length:315 start_codon:yes stop_codon:yes gene_type:complete
MHKLVMGLMIIKKIIIGIFLLGFLNGCVQNAALLGPMYTFGSSGSLYQTGLSYSSTQAISSLTGRSTEENIKMIFKPKKQYSDLQKLVKKQIETTRKRLKLSNQ